MSSAYFWDRSAVRLNDAPGNQVGMYRTAEAKLLRAMRNIKDRRRLTEWEETKNGGHLWTYGCYCEVDGPINYVDDRIVLACSLVTVYHRHDDRGRVSTEEQEFEFEIGKYHQKQTHV